jgi:protein O-GlcNAc transferase
LGGLDPKREEWVTPLAYGAAQPGLGSRRFPKSAGKSNTMGKRTAARGKGSSAAPEKALVHLRRALELRKEGHSQGALEELRLGLIAAPAFAELHHQRGNVLKSLGRFSEAAASLREALRIEPKNSVVLLNLGVSLLELGAFEEAADCLARAVAIEPSRPEAHNILGHALLSMGLCSEAISEFETAVRLRPGFAAPLDNLGRALKAQGRAAEGIARHREALASAPSPATHSNLLYSLNLIDLDPGAVLAEHVVWGRLHGSAGPLPKEGMPEPATGRRLRVGYVSPDFVNHAVAYFFAPVLAHHDRGRFEVFCYSNAKVPDGVTQRLRGMAEHWRDIALLGDDEAADCIRADGIDILVDLAGHTAHNRLLVFARKPAPVQVTWLGYPGTSGLKEMDYRLTDAASDPPGTSDAAYVEKLVRLADTFSCYEPSPDSPAVSPLPAERSGHVTFGCFNNFAKVTPEMIALWAQVLLDTPGSRLLLKSRGFADPGTRALVSSRFAETGVDAVRIVFDGQVRSVAEHLRLYERVDIALDTYPYNGATTTCEALWMGVPVVTWAGRTHASRVGASFLPQVGLGSCVAGDGAGYRRVCRELASDIPALAGLRAGLRDQMGRSTLCDAPRFVRHLETALGAMCAAAPRVAL